MIDSFHRRWIARIGSELVSDMTSPFQSASEGTLDGGRNFFSIFPDFFRTRAENVALRKHVGELEQQVVTLEEKLRQERRLNDLIEYSGQFNEPTIIARVIATNPTGWFSTIVVDKGAADGVRKHLPVISAMGLVGHVIEVSRYSSKILLLTDPNSKVGVIVQDGRAQGVVQGDNENGFVLKYVERSEDIRSGDILITSGNSRIYPKGLLVGYIAEAKSSMGNLFQWARVIPRTNFRKLEEVAILVMLEHPEYLPVSEPAQETDGLDAN
jgi:rod shape-determining protein MreC